MGLLKLGLSPVQPGAPGCSRLGPSDPPAVPSCRRPSHHLHPFIHLDVAETSPPCRYSPASLQQCRLLPPRMGLTPGGDQQLLPVSMLSAGEAAGDTCCREGPLRLSHGNFSPNLCQAGARASPRPGTGPWAWPQQVPSLSVQWPVLPPQAPPPILGVLLNGACPGLHSHRPWPSLGLLNRCPSRAFKSPPHSSFFPPHLRTFFPFHCF